MPELIASLHEADVTTSCYQNARIVPSDQPGHICIEVSARVSAAVRYSDTENEGDAFTPSSPVTTYNEGVTRNETYTHKFYFPVNLTPASVTVGGIAPSSAPDRIAYVNDVTTVAVEEGLRQYVEKMTRKADYSFLYQNR